MMSGQVSRINDSFQTAIGLKGLTSTYFLFFYPYYSLMPLASASAHFGNFSGWVTSSQSLQCLILITVVSDGSAVLSGHI